jgi:hypothetical protein
VKRSMITIVAVTSVLVLVACGGDNKTSAPPTSSGATGSGAPSSAPPTTAEYKVAVDQMNFSTRITNKYFPLKPGTADVYDGTRDGVPNHTEKVVTNETKVIMGVTCVVVRDTVTSNAALVEQTVDWYAQASNGDVWYFGEDTKEFTNGAVSSTHGSWEAGVDRAQPGIVMKGNPTVGDRYRQEFRPGEAEDMAKVLQVHATKHVPGGSFTNVVVTDDSDPLNPDKIDEKSYGPGVGLIYSKRIRSGHHEEMSYVKTTS